MVHKAIARLHLIIAPMWSRLKSQKISLVDTLRIFTALFIGHHSCELLQHGNLKTRSSCFNKWDNKLKNCIRDSSRANQFRGSSLYFPIFCLVIYPSFHILVQMSQTTHHPPHTTTCLPTITSSNTHTNREKTKDEEEEPTIIYWIVGELFISNYLIILGTKSLLLPWLASCSFLLFKTTFYLNGLVTSNLIWLYN